MAKYKGEERVRWGTYNGRSLYIDEMDDMHLGNVIAWVSEGTRNWSTSILKALNKEVIKRNLKKEFLNRAPFPHQNENGEWILFINGSPTVVGRGK